MSLRLFKQLSFTILRHFAAARYRRLLHGATPNCILVLQYTMPLGGCVHVTPLFAALHDGLPQLPVYVATRALGAEVLRHNPNIAGLIITPDVFSDLHGAGKALSSALHQKNLRPGWIITDAGNRRTRIALLATLYCGAPMVGFNLAEALQSITLRRDVQRSMIENNLQIAHVLGADSMPREPRMYTSQKDIESARQLLAEVNPRSLPVVVFSSQPSGGQPTAWWPERWAPVVQYIVAQNLLPIFVGTAHQSAAIDHIRNLAGVSSATVAGRTHIGMLSALLALSDLCISIDTGTLHVARAVDLPCVALAPTFQTPVEWLPIQWPKARVLRGEGIYPSSPDYHLDEIEPSSVIAATDELLHHYPADTASREQRVQIIQQAIDHLATLP